MRVRRPDRDLYRIYDEDEFFADPGSPERRGRTVPDTGAATARRRPSLRSGRRSLRAAGMLLAALIAADLAVLRGGTRPGRTTGLGERGAAAPRMPAAPRTAGQARRPRSARAHRLPARRRAQRHGERAARRRLRFDARRNERFGAPRISSPPTAHGREIAAPASAAAVAPRAEGVEFGFER